MDDQSNEPEIEVGDTLYFSMSFTLENPWPIDLLGPKDEWTLIKDDI